MKKSLLVLAGASMLVMGAPSVSMTPAQAASGNFADVPSDHWAYPAVGTLQSAGIVIGYPDGTYGGKRAMTRYEFAVAIARLLPLLTPKDTSNFATKDDLAALRADLESKLAANQDAITALRKLVDEFEPELKKLGQDVAAVNARLDTLEARVAAVEEEQRRVKFNGWLNFIARGNVATQGDGHGGFVDFVDKNGVFNAGNKHIFQKSDVYHDFVLGIRGKLSDTATANVKVDFGNFLSFVGNTAQAGNTLEPGDLGPSDQKQTVWEANLEQPVSLGPLGGADLVVGRFGNQWTPYTLQQVDADIYTGLMQTDSGNLTTDGAKVNLKLGPAAIQGWAGKFSAIPFVMPFGGSTDPNFEQSAHIGGLQFRPTGQIALNQATALKQGAGLRATIGAPENSVLGVSVEQFGTSGVIADPARPKTYDKLSVYGVDFSGAIPFISKATGVTLNAAWTVSAHGLNNGFNNIGNNWKFQSTDDQLGIVLGALTLKGGYQYIGPYFSAPGYWGKVGAWTNPTNVEGGVGSAKYKFGPKLSLNADVQSYKTAYGAVSGSPLQQGDKLTRYQVGVGYDLTSQYAVDLGYENVMWDLKNVATIPSGVPGKPQESYTTIGIGHNLNANTSVKFLYQIVEFKDKGTGFGGGDSKGGVAVGQFSLHF